MTVMVFFIRVPIKVSNVLFEMMFRKYVRTDAVFKDTCTYMYLQSKTYS